MILKCKGRFCMLEECSPDTEIELRELIQNNEMDWRLLVSDASVSDTLKLFTTKDKPKYCFFVRENRNRKVVGVFLFSGLNSNGYSINISCFFEPKVRKSILAGEAISLAVAFPKEMLGVKNIYFNVYEENITMQEFAKTLGAEEIGTAISQKNKERIVKKYILHEDKILKISSRIKKFERR